MKRLILILCMLTGIAYGQRWQNMPQAGYGPIKQLWIDSNLVIPTAALTGTLISGGRAVAQLRYNETDSSLEVYTGYQWLNQKGAGSTTDTASLSDRINLKVDSVTFSGDSLYYWVNGTGTGLALPGGAGTFSNPNLGDTLLTNPATNEFVIKSLIAEYGILHATTDTTVTHRVDTSVISPKFTLTTTNTADATTYSSNIINVPLVDGYLSAALQVTNRYIDSSSNQAVAEYFKTFTKRLVNFGIYRKFFAIYPFSGDSTVGVSTNKWNMIDPDDDNYAFRMTFPNGSTKTSKGVTFDGTNDYGESFFDWEYATNAPYLGVSVYRQTLVTGCYISAGATSGYRVWFYDSDAKSYLYIQGTPAGITVPYGNKRGLSEAQRTRDGQVQYYQSGLYLLGTDLAVSTSTSGGATIKVNYNNTTPLTQTNELSLFAIHQVFTVQENADWNSAVQELMINLSRYVIQ